MRFAKKVLNYDELYFTYHLIRFVRLRRIQPVRPVKKGKMPGFI